MSRWEYSDMSMIMLCGVSRKGARNLSFINVYEREIEKFKNGEEEKIAELIEEIENEKLKTQIILTGERCIPFKIERRQGSPLSFTSVSTKLDFLAKTMNKEIEV